MYRLDEIEIPRLQSCSFYPYTVNETGDVVLLMRNKKDSKNPNFYVDFGTTIRENEPNILFSATRSYLVKTLGLCLGSEVQNINNIQYVEKKLND